jgi:hypothetical protein
MQSFLIIGKPFEKTKDYAFNFCEKNKIDKFDISFIESEKAVGITQVRDFQKKIFLKPFKSRQKAVILSAQNQITQEAQNALLKVLEEPPENTIIMLLSESAEGFLPTVISRCKVIILDKESSEINIKESGKILLSLRNAGIGERLKLAQDNSKDKESALLFVEGLILASEVLLKDSKDKELVDAVRFMQKTYTGIKNTNANLRLSVENLLLNLFYN